jgi:aminoglycoside phosphotransferase family enzyme/predicted kinase
MRELRDDDRPDGRDLFFNVNINTELKVTNTIEGDDAPIKQQRLVDSLLSGAAFSAAPAERIEHLETHISHVILVGDRAYKIKKPLNLGFLDFTGLDRRRHFCEEEIRLNRRLAPEVYLDCLPINGTAEAPVLGGDPRTAIEFAVRMRRFPQEALLNRVAEAGELRAEHIDELAKSLAQFHQQASVASEPRFGQPDQVLQPMLDNFSHTRSLLTDAGALADLGLIEAWTRSQGQALGERLAERREQGRVRECHGDVHLGNVTLLQGRPLLFDCIEFNDDFRWIDVMSDLGFLLMDLDARGLSALAWRALTVYLECSGDYPGLAVLPLYRCYRAMVRAKVAAIRDSQGDESAMQECRQYLRLARRYTEPRALGVVLTQGLSGSGKSTVSALLYPALGAIRIRSDVERKRLFDLSPAESAAAAPGQGIYSETAKKRVYRHLAGLVELATDAGFAVLIDAANLQRWQRDALYAAAASRRVALVVLACEAPQEKLRGWLRARSRARDDASDANEAVLDRQLQSMQPMSPDEAPVVVVRSDQAIDVDGLVRRVRAAWETSRKIASSANG